jgi:hypothetical protein
MIAVNRVTPKINAYRAVARPGAVPADQVGAVAAAGGVAGFAARPQPQVEQTLPPYINTRGETTGTVVNTTV